MKITEVRIFPTESKDGKLKAFATMTFDDWFVVRNVKVIQGNSGLFVAMPSRKAVDSCPKCNFKNVVGSKYCNQCGSRFEQRQAPDENARETYGNHMDIAHPITQECRVYIQEKILGAYNKEIGQAFAEPETAGKAKARESGFSGERTESGQSEKIPEMEDSKDIEL